MIKKTKPSPFGWTSNDHLVGVDVMKLRYWGTTSGKDLWITIFFYNWKPYPGQASVGFNAVRAHKVCFDLLWSNTHSFQFTLMTSPRLVYASPEATN